jgi:hypothetical protein
MAKRSGSGPFEKLNQGPDKNRPVPQHVSPIPRSFSRAALSGWSPNIGIPSIGTLQHKNLTFKNTT